MSDNTATQPPLNAEDPRCLRDVPIFQALSEKELEKILRSEDCFLKQYAAQATVIQEGEIGDCMFVILGGAVEVLVKKSHGRGVGVAAVLHRGDFFGEEAMMPWKDGRRNASVRTIQSTQLLHVNKRHVLYGLQKGIQNLCASKVFGTSLDSLSSIMSDGQMNSGGAVMEQDFLEVPKADPVLDILKASRIFKSLSDKEVKAYKSWSKTETYKMGQYIMREGDPGRYLHLMIKGTVTVLYSDRSDKLHVLATLKKGQYFGEQALLPGGNKRANAYVRSETDCAILKISVKTFNTIMRRDQLLFASLKKSGVSQRNTLRKLSQV